MLARLRYGESAAYQKPEVGEHDALVDIDAVPLSLNQLVGPTCEGPCYRSIGDPIEQSDFLFCVA